MEIIGVDKLDTDGPGPGASMKQTKPGCSTGTLWLACLYALLRGRHACSCTWLKLLRCTGLPDCAAGEPADLPDDLAINGLLSTFPASGAGMEPGGSTGAHWHALSHSFKHLRQTTASAMLVQIWQAAVVSLLKLNLGAHLLRPKPALRASTCCPQPSQTLCRQTAAASLTHQAMQTRTQAWQAWR